MHSVWSLQGESEAGGSAVVEDVNGEARDRELIQELRDHCCEIVEGILEALWDGGESESGEVWGEHAVLLRQDGDEVTILVRGGREAVEEEDHWGGFRAGLSVEDLGLGGWKVLVE